jgi:rifampicin phosphotransferase
VTESQVMVGSPRIYAPNGNSPGPEDIGGKARGLLAISEAGLPTPPWFVVRPATVVAEGGAEAELRSSIAEACRRLGDGRIQRYAVRSSAQDEDAPEQSFAGQYHTSLDVSGLDNILQAVTACVESGHEPSLAAYRRAQGLPLAGPTVAVIVQAFVEPRTAGVAFGRAPLTGADEVVIGAVRGVGTPLVNGAVNGDEYRVTRDGHVTVVRADAEPMLSVAQAREVAAATRHLEDRRGAPQDIEWVYSASDELAVVQTRQITTLPSHPEAREHVRVWDNANIVESFPDLTLPLTFSVAVELYATVYRNACLALGVPRRTVEQESAVFEQMLGLHRGQVYYNLSSWYRVLAMLPGFRLNAGFLEAMMGAGRPGSRPAERPLAKMGATARRWEITVMCARLVYRLLRFDRDAGRFRGSIGRLVDAHQSSLGGSRPEDVLREFESVRMAALSRWREPIMNDLFLMMAHGALRRVAETWLGADANRLVNELLVQGNVASAASGAELLRIVAVIQARPDWSAIVESTPPDQLLERLASDVELDGLDQLVGGYLATWADRAPRELQLERSSYRDDPLPLLRTLRSLVSAPAASQATIGRAPTLESRRRLLAMPRGRLRFAIFSFLLRATRKHVRWREEMRLARGQIFGIGRRLFKDLGVGLRDLGVLEQPDDVHYLSLSELRGLIHGTTVIGDPRDLVSRRRREYEAYAHSPRLPSRFETVGIVAEAPVPRAREGTVTPPDGPRMLRGTGVAAGKTRGQCAVVHDPSLDTPEPGRIIATRTTDPGWIPLLVGAGGILVEQGSLLSHSAIVARELGIPMVVGLVGLLDVVRTGDIAEFDGSTGEVWLSTERRDER